MDKIDNNKLNTGINLKINIIKEVDDENLDRASHVSNLGRQTFNFLNATWQNITSKTAFISAGSDCHEMNVKLSIMLFNKTKPWDVTIVRQELNKPLPMKTA